MCASVCQLQVLNTVVSSHAPQRRSSVGRRTLFFCTFFFFLLFFAGGHVIYFDRSYSAHFTQHHEQRTAREAALASVGTPISSWQTSLQDLFHCTPAVTIYIDSPTHIIKHITQDITPTPVFPFPPPSGISFITWPYLRYPQSLMVSAELSYLLFTILDLVGFV